MASIWLLIMWLQRKLQNIYRISWCCHGPEGPPWILHAVLVAALCQDRPENLVTFGHPGMANSGEIFFAFLTYGNMMKYGGFLKYYHSIFGG